VQERRVEVQEERHAGVDRTADKRAAGLRHALGLVEEVYGAARPPVDVVDVRPGNLRRLVGAGLVPQVRLLASLIAEQLGSRLARCSAGEAAAQRAE
jgi:hypothetical protein